jgi:hypothetical protein
MEQGNVSGPTIRQHDTNRLYIITYYQYQPHEELPSNNSSFKYFHSFIFEGLNVTLNSINNSDKLVQSIAGQKIKVIAALPDWDIKALNISSLYKYIYIDPIASATTNHSSQRDNPS